MSRPASGGSPPSNRASSTGATGVAGGSASTRANASSSSSDRSSDVESLNAKIKSLMGQPVQISLRPISPATQNVSEQGLLWAHDAQMGVVALEMPKSFPASSSTSILSTPYPKNAASYPTAQLSSLKVAAQGGDASGSRTNFILLKVSRIISIAPLDTATDENQKSWKLTPCRDINVQAAESRERAASSEALKRAAKIGVGVSQLGQDVFDALSKTLPCRWLGQNIVVMDEILVAAPSYDKASIPAINLDTLRALADGKDVPGAPLDGKQKATRWQRVSKVLEGERRKISAKQEG